MSKDLSNLGRPLKNFNVQCLRMLLTNSNRRPKPSLCVRSLHKVVKVLPKEPSIYISHQKPFRLHPVLRPHYWSLILSTTVGQHIEKSDLALFNVYS